MSLKHALAASAAIALLGATSACSLSSTPAAGAAGASGASSSAAAGTRGSVVNGGGTAKDGGTLDLSMAVDPLCLDPHAISSDVEQIFGRIMFDNLVYLDADGQPSPWVAKSWDISDGGKTYTFHLRSGITFSDGAVLDAAAVKANFEHMLDPETRSPLAGSYIAPYVDSTVVDPQTLEVHLSAPYSPFLNVLAQGWLGLESPKAIAADDPAQLCEQPVGSGPFVLTSYTKNQGVTFAKRDGYDWGPPALHQSGGPHLDGIDVTWVGQDAVRYNSLVSGQYQATGYVPAQNAQAVASNPDLVYQNINRIGLPATVEFNTSRAPFDDLKVRQAFTAGLDVPAILQTIGFGQRKQPHGFLDAVTQYADGSIPVTEHDAARANKLLDQAGWTGRDGEGYRTKAGTTLEAHFPISQAGTISPIYDLVQAQAKEIGVKVDLDLVPPAQYTTLRYGGDYDLLFGVWHTNTPDVLYIKYASKSIPTPQRLGQNLSHLSDAKIDGWLDQARQSTDEATQRSLYQKVQQRLAELQPGVPVYDNSVLWAVSKKLHGTVVDTSHGTPLFTYSWLEG